MNQDVEGRKQSRRYPRPEKNNILDRVVSKENYIEISGAPISTPTKRCPEDHVVRNENYKTGLANFRNWPIAMSILPDVCELANLSQLAHLVIQYCLIIVLSIGF